MAEVKLNLNLDSLLNLPTGASYNAKSGRANVKVSKSDAPGQIIVYASCDSLQRLVNYYESTQGLYEKRLKQTEQHLAESYKHRSNATLTKLLYTFLAGVALGLILKLIIKKTIKQ